MEKQDISGENMRGSIKKIGITGWLILIVCLMPRLGGAQSGHVQTFAEANQYFHQALNESDPAAAADLYQRALLRYEKLVDAGVENGKLYYNIGNTYYRLGDIGRAILNYKRARKYIPEDENLQKNLAFVETQRKDRIEPQTGEKIFKTLLFWHYDIPFRIKLYCSLGAYAMFWGFLCLRFYVRRSGVVWGMALALIVAVLMGSSVGWEHVQSRRKEGVLLADEVVARKGDGYSYQQSFEAPLHAGTDFLILERRGQWLYIALKDGRKCWVPSDAAETV